MKDMAYREERKGILGWLEFHGSKAMTSDFHRGHARLWAAVNAVEWTVPSAAIEIHIAIEREALYRLQQTMVPLHSCTESRRIQLFLVPLGLLLSEQGLVVVNYSDIWRMLGGTSRQLQ
jgi:hypothetical protein